MVRRAYTVLLSSAKYAHELWSDSETSSGRDPGNWIDRIIACSNASSSEFEKLAEEIAKDHLNTRIIGYPYITTEEDSLALIDDVLNSWGRLDVWATSSGLLGPPSIDDTSPAKLRKCFEANAMAPFITLKYAPPAMAKMTPGGNYPNAAPKDVMALSLSFRPSHRPTADAEVHALR
jgi:NAD(P)-dependent dehydrogenase (short-subunit alcohol dehydrogenase family)